MKLTKAYKAGAGFILALTLMTACSGKKNGDPRLIGTWHSNQAQTMAAALQSDPKMAEAPPEQLEAFKKQFGQLSLTYTDTTIAIRHHDTFKTFQYHVVERGDDFVVIQTTGAVEDGRDIRMRFADSNRAYWVDTGLGYLEKFDKTTQ